MIRDASERRVFNILRWFIFFIRSSAVATAEPLVEITRASVTVLRASSLETASVDILGLMLVSVSGS